MVKKLQCQVPLFHVYRVVTRYIVSRLIPHFGLKF